MRLGPIDDEAFRRGRRKGHARHHKESSRPRGRVRYPKGNRCGPGERFQHEGSMKRKSTQSRRSFPFLQINEGEAKPRKRGLTEIRGPYYSAYGRRHLQDLFETMGAYIDSLKFAGGAFTLMPERAVREIV